MARERRSRSCSLTVHWRGFFNRWHWAITAYGRRDDPGHWIFRAIREESSLNATLTDARLR